MILYFATSTGTSLKASPRVSSLDHCLYNCCQIVHSNLKCTTNFYSALAILPPLDPDRVFFLIIDRRHVKRKNETVSKMRK